MLTGVGGRNFQTVQNDSLAPKNMYMFQKSKIARFLKFIKHHQLGTAATRALRERLSQGWLGRRSGQMAVGVLGVIYRTSLWNPELSIYLMRSYD